MLLLLTACQSDQTEAAKPEAPEEKAASESVKETNAAEEDRVKEEGESEAEEPAVEIKKEEASSSTEQEKETKTEEVSSPAEQEEEPKTEDAGSTAVNDEDPLAGYSSNEIEYARVWLQLGPNQEIDELNVRLIPAGTALNPDDDTSAVYPEDVIQLAGSRLVDGSITYSGNGDGTVNVYNVPLRWDGQYPAGKEFYEDLLKQTKKVSIDTGNDEEVIKLIKKIKLG
ncbi:hypothetical protein GKZ89_12580 [Bacillus mangrovi]|uniref:Uncharacterized protein n=1 Tax=Metabacillus mangrovi TaxID=1491830 RepID=A0A7X2V5J5_9BACI|nr:hypothetical protein [Metabacillus mangrovi]